MVTAVFAQVAGHVLPEPRWYLRQIAVDPALQGHGHGAALLAAGLAEIDARGEPAYLEATSDASRRFYSRHDFEHVASARAGGSRTSSAVCRLRPAPRVWRAAGVAFAAGRHSGSNSRPGHGPVAKVFTCNTSATRHPTLADRGPVAAVI